MAFIKDKDWEKYIDTINKFQEDAFQHEIIWKRAINSVTRFNEGEIRRETITLKGLIQYNEFRNWPITLNTDTGALDKQSVMVYFNIKYLEELGYTDQYGNLLVDHGLDDFIINGVKYKPQGDSQVSQAKDKPILTYIILKREEIDTGNTYNEY